MPTFPPTPHSFFSVHSTFYFHAKQKTEKFLCFSIQAISRPANTNTTTTKRAKKLFANQSQNYTHGNGMWPKLNVTLAKVTYQRRVSNDPGKKWKNPAVAFVAHSARPELRHLNEKKFSDVSGPSAIWPRSECFLYDTWNWWYRNIGDRTVWGRWITRTFSTSKRRGFTCAKRFSLGHWTLVTFLSRQQWRNSILKRGIWRVNVVVSIKT